MWLFFLLGILYKLLELHIMDVKVNKKDLTNLKDSGFCQSKHCLNIWHIEGDS